MIVCGRPIIVGIIILILLFGCASAPSSQANQPSSTQNPTGQKEAFNKALSRSLMNPCLMPLAFRQGTLLPGYCFYNGTVEAISCGANISLLHKGIFYNITNSPAKINACGVVALTDEYNETYFAFIWKNRDGLISLDNITSVTAIVTKLTRTDCEG